MGPGGPTGPGDPRGMIGSGGAGFDPRGPMMMGPDGPMMGPGGPRGMMEPGGTQNIVSRHSSVQTVTVSQDIMSGLEVFSQCADVQLTGPGRVESMCGVCSQVPPDVQLTGPGRVESICGVSIV